MRTERDSMGEVGIPEDQLWGAQTHRAIENFPISDIRFSGHFIRVLAMVKCACAKANTELGILDKALSGVVI